MKILSFGRYRLCPESRLLEQDGVAVPLGSRALDILILLTSRAGELVSTRELMSRVWRGIVIGPGAVRVHINTLRKALGDGRGGARYVSNVSGLGYCFVAPIRLASPLEHADGLPQVQALQQRVLELQRLLGEKTRQCESLEKALCRRRVPRQGAALSG